MPLAPATAETPATQAALHEDKALTTLLDLRTDNLMGIPGPTWLLDERLASLLGVPLESLDRSTSIAALTSLAYPTNYALEFSGAQYVRVTP